MKTKMMVEFWDAGWLEIELTGKASLQQSQRKIKEVIMPDALRMLTLSGFLLVTILGFSNAHAASFTNGATVCLDDEGGFSTNGTLVRSFPCNVTFAQDWSFDGVRILGPGTTFGTAGKCLDVKGGGTASGTPIDLFDCTGSGAQQWRYFNSRLVNLGSGKCLDVGLVPATIAPDNTGPIALVGPVQTSISASRFAAGPPARPPLPSVGQRSQDDSFPGIYPKVDRLTRSLADFAKIVDVLDVHNASFVSVTHYCERARSFPAFQAEMPSTWTPRVLSSGPS